jgi:hypothetical protein
MIPFPPIPDPLEVYGAQVDDRFSRASQRTAFRQYLIGLLLPREHTKTLTALANVERMVRRWPAANRAEATVVPRRAKLERRRAHRSPPGPAAGRPGHGPHAGGVLIIDETGDCKDGIKTAQVERQYLGNRGKIEQGIVSVGSV